MESPAKYNLLIPGNLYRCKNRQVEIKIGDIVMVIRGEKRDSGMYFSDYFNLIFLYNGNLVCSSGWHKTAVDKDVREALEPIGDHI